VKKLLTIFMMVVFFCAALGNPLVSTAPNERSRYIQFLAGVEFLDQKPDLSIKIRAEKYRDLCRVTGVSASLATEFILKFAESPEEWKKVRADILDLLQTIK
jgi:hypothetical protein